MHGLNHWLLRLHQAVHPREFRLPVEADEPLDAVLAALLVQQNQLGRALESLRGVAPEEAPARTSDSPPAGAAPADAPTSTVDPALAIALCNGYDRVLQNSRQMTAQGTDSKQLRSIRRALETIEETLRGHGIEYLDLTGQAYHPGREDFEPLGEPEASAEVSRPTIARCERPAVLVQGRLVQRARGIVVCPLQSPSETEGVAHGGN